MPLREYFILYGVFVCECAVLPKYCSSISMTSQSPEKGKSRGKMPEMEVCLVIKPVCAIQFLLHMKHF